MYQNLMASFANNKYWLTMFFPYAPYILTDFQHLAVGKWRALPVWYDVMMLVWFSFTGLLRGSTSLFLMHEIMRREFGRRWGWGFVAIVAILSGAGVYFGRFLRLDSRDVFSNPGAMTHYTIESVQSPGMQTVGFISL